MSHYFSDFICYFW